MGAGRHPAAPRNRNKGVAVRKVYFVITVLLLISVVVQFYFAALGVFGPEDADLFVFHSINGQYVLPGLALLAVIFAALSRAGVRTVLLSALPILLVAVQILLFILAGALTGGSEENPTVAGAIILGLHAINALAILGVIITLVRRARLRAWPKSGADGPTPATA
jgi:prepilin signal peptidase PulO-like enzyme (type II secretory pathway)